MSTHANGPTLQVMSAVVGRRDMHVAPCTAGEGYMLLLAFGALLKIHDTTLHLSQNCESASSFAGCSVCRVPLESAKLYVQLSGPWRGHISHLT